MGNKQKKSSGGKKKKHSLSSVVDPDAAGSIGGNSYGLIMVDPARCRFQHSKIRPYFSGCGRSVEKTLEEIKEGTTKISDIPPIQVLVGDESMDDNLGPWYFSLNNRRLWVLKRLREEGYLERYGNKVAVRVRRPKSKQEKERYTLANCSLQAKLIPEKKKQSQQRKQLPNSSSKPVSEETENGVDEASRSIHEQQDSDDTDESGDNDNDHYDSQTLARTRNRFANILMDDSSSDED